MPLERMRLEELEYGFFLCGEKLYFAFPHGNWVLYFPVRDGKIQRCSDESNIFSFDMITVIPISEVSKYGLTIKEDENPMDPKFWSKPKSLK